MPKKVKTSINSWFFRFVATALVASTLTPHSQAQELSARNTSQYIGNGRWDWTVFINPSFRNLNDIDSVEYTLHPTFPNPVRTVRQIGNLRYPFALSSKGWGVFDISIKVFLKNKTSRKLKHRLTFDQPSSDTLPITASNIARKISRGWWEWTVYVQGSEQALAQVRCVEYTLHPTFPNPIRTVCKRGSGVQAFPFTTKGWGTFEIGIRLIFKNGRIQKLKHQLKF
ncbi:MAG: hypothetical protein L0196_09000 [candidate division Zixibacteria bacterium]|nr:hypothetical protein [candidate division Zixibacteria bacterium]